MITLHRAAGLTIAATQPIPGLAAATSSGPADVFLHLGIAAPWPPASTSVHFSSGHSTPDGRPIVIVRRAAEGFHFQYADGTDVWISNNGADVWCRWRDGTAMEDTATYLTGPILGFVLRLKGALALHASAVQIDGSALLIVGPHGAGKSTTAAALGTLGFAVITDDVLHARRAKDEWLAEPFEGPLRLWESGAALALGASSELPRLTPTWTKCGLAMGTRIKPALAAVPIRAVAFLQPRLASDEPPCLEPMTGADALVQFAVHSSAAQLIDPVLRAREFTALSEFVQTVACVRAFASDSEARFAEYLDLVQEWARRQVDVHV